jgi:ribosome-associated translation inhibitor RaiA
VQLSISARHGHLGASAQDKIKEKVERLKRFFDRVSAIDVTVDLENHDLVGVEVRVSAEHTADFVASESAKPTNYSWP